MTPKPYPYDPIMDKALNAFLWLLFGIAVAAVTDVVGRRMIRRRRKREKNGNQTSL